MSVIVTIGVCVKNSERTIKQTIESIINQNYPVKLIQLVVVDGCSEDKTLSIINSVTSKTSMLVEILSDKGEGLGTARQIVVDNAKGKYIIFADSDVRLFSDFVRNHVKFMEENPGIGAAFGASMLHDGKLVAKVWNLTIYATERSRSCVFIRCSDKVKFVNRKDKAIVFGGETIIYSSEVLRQIGGFDKKIKGAAEDTDLIIRLRLHGFQVSANETARFFHDHRESLISFWVEQSWYGYGSHYCNHKYGSIHILWRKFPLGAFVHSISLASIAFKRTRKKLSFLILPQMVFANIAWWAGFVKAHKEGYGHRRSL